MILSSSLIVSTYNWPEALNLVLESIHKQKILPNELIIADDGSDERTKNLIASWNQKLNIPVHHVWIPDDGFRKTIVLNKALSLAKGEYIIQLDGDSIAHPLFVSDHLQFAKKGSFVQGSRVLLDETTTKKIIDSGEFNLSFKSKGITNRFNAMHIPFLTRFFDNEKPSIAGIRGSNMAFWKEDVVAVNGYNEEMTGWGREDSELAARFVNSGLMRRKLKMGAIQFHLFHKKEKRNRLNINDNILEQVIKQKIQRCNKGMQQYD